MNNLSEFLHKYIPCVDLTDFLACFQPKTLAKKDFLVRPGDRCDFLEAFIRKMKLKDIILLGHDTGGPSGFLVAEKFPDLFKGVIFTDTIIFPVKEYPRISFMLGLLNTFPIRWLNRWANFILKATLRFGVGKRPDEATRKQYEALFVSGKQRNRIIDLLFSLKSNHKALQKIKEGFENHLNSIPALLIYGEKDPIYEMGIADRIKSLMPNSILHTISGEGHFPHETEGKQMAKLITDWIKQTYRNETIPAHREITSYTG